MGRAPVEMTHGVSRVVLDARLGQQHAGWLVEEMRGLRGRSVEMDASRVESVSALCLQALLSAAVSWRADGHRLAIVAPSPAFLAALVQAGLDPMLFHSPEGARCP